MTEATTLRAARLVAGGAAVIAGAVLADSAIEHYRGSFDNKGMAAPLAVSALLLVADGAVAVSDKSGGAVSPTMAINAAGALTGAAGLGFHVYNVTKKVGGIRWGNLFYQAPIGAPAALVLADALGAAGQILAEGRTHLGPVSLTSGRALAGLSAFGIAGTAIEVALLHFRGAYHNPAMWLPVSIAPISAIALTRAALTGRSGRVTTVSLAATGAIGLVGSAFHAHGISRRMGGWRNWRQNLLAGPPLSAPPSLTGLALAGLGALLLISRFSRD